MNVVDCNRAKSSLDRVSIQLIQLRQETLLREQPDDVIQAWLFVIVTGFPDQPVNAHPIHTLRHQLPQFSRKLRPKRP